MQGGERVGVHRARPARLASPAGQAQARTASSRTTPQAANHLNDKQLYRNLYRYANKIGTNAQFLSKQPFENAYTKLTRLFSIVLSWIYDRFRAIIFAISQVKIGTIGTGLVQVLVQLISLLINNLSLNCTNVPKFDLFLLL